MPLRLYPYPVPRLLVSSGPGHPRLATVPTPGAVADALAAGDLGPALYAQGRGASGTATRAGRAGRNMRPAIVARVERIGWWTSTCCAPMFTHLPS